MLQGKKVSALRFKKFKDEWEEKRLKELTTYKNGIGHEDKQRSSGKYELVNLNSISIEGGLKSSGKFINVADTTLQVNDLVMVLSDVGHGDLLGRVALIPVNNRYVLNQRVALLRPNASVNGKYLLYNINANQRYFKLSGAGMSQLNISKSSVENFTSFYPTLPEQNQIGNFFKTLDELIALQEQKHTKLKQLKKAMLDKMFPKAGTKVPEIRFRGFTEDWEEKRLGEICTFSKGNGYSKNDLSGFGIPIILYGRMYTKYRTSILEVDTFSFARDKAVYSKGNEVIVPASGETAEDISRASAVLQAGIILGGDINVLIPNYLIDSIFLALSLSHGHSKYELSKRAKGKSVVHIHNSDLKDVAILYPSLSEQQKIGAYFEELDKSIEGAQQQIEKYKNIKQALLSKMFV